MYIRIAGRYIQHEYETCLEADMLPSNRRLLIRTYVTTAVLALIDNIICCKLWGIFSSLCHNTVSREKDQNVFVISPIKIGDSYEIRYTVS